MSSLNANKVKTNMCSVLNQCFILLYYIINKGHVLELYKNKNKKGSAIIILSIKISQ